MSCRKLSGWLLCLLLLSWVTLPVLAQEDRGKAELSAPGGKITIDYGRPQLKGRDPLTWQKDGSYWRMGMNEMTTLTTPVDLMFGNTKITKGTYGLWLLKAAADRYELVFNSEASGMGMSHDKSKDIGGIPLKKESVPKSLETFTIELKGAPKGGTFAMVWGTVSLSTGFQMGK